MKQRKRGDDFRELQTYMLDYDKRKGFRTDRDSIMLKLLLLVSEIAEATEAYRDQGIVEPFHNHKVMAKFIKLKGLDEEYFKYHKSIYRGKHSDTDLREELADLQVRLADLAAIAGMDLYDETWKKMRENEQRGFRHGRRIA